MSSPASVLATEFETAAQRAARLCPPPPPDPDHPFKEIYCGHCGEPETIQLGCGHRSCAVDRAKWFRRNYDLYVELVKGWRSIRFLTLTIKNILELGRRDVARFRGCFAELRLRFPQIALGFYVVQAPNHGNGWHLHVHALYDGAYVKQKDLSKAWLEITGDSKIVGIEKASSPEKAVGYLLRDFLQAPKIRPEDVEDFDGVFKGSRMVQQFGSLAARAKIRLGNRVRKPHPCKKCGHDCWIGNLDDLFDEEYKRKYPLALYNEFEDDS